MARLTEEMVIARTRASDLSNIRKLNCWGSELTDVSLLRRMNNVEVLSLSVNKISGLSDFQFCRNLQELYVRKNNIRDLNQICYLQDLPRLKNLWLEENPCAVGDSYRLTVLRALPHLQKLDNVAVQPEEVQDAGKKGQELVHPDEEEQQWPSEPSSPALSPIRDQEYVRQMESSYYEEYEDERIVSTPSRQHSPPRRQGINDRDLETDTFPRKHSSPEDEINYYETDRRNANYDSESPMFARPPAKQYISYERSPTSTYPDQQRSPSSINPKQPSPSDSVKDDLVSNIPGGSSSPSKDISPSSEEVQRIRNSCVYQNHDPRDSGSDGSGGSHYTNRGKGSEENIPSQVYERGSRQTQQIESLPQRVINNRPLFPRRPTTKNSNILSAVLCLIKELDYPSLEVVEMAVRSRIEEF